MLPIIDKDLEKQLPPLYEQDGKEEQTIYARFYSDEWEWFALEYSPLQKLFFGLVDEEYRYFTVDELESFGVVRDYNFEPKVIQGDTYGKRVA